MVLMPGTLVDRYRVQFVLGRGGMATVYAVRHTVLGTLHALKVLDLASPSLHDRLVREGQVQARLDPEYVLPVMDVVSVNGAPALLMPLVRGCSLRQVLDERRLTDAEVLDLFSPIARGVASAHSHHVVHRDLKPTNALLEEKRGRLLVRVADFGLARTLDPSTTRSGTMLGTPAYAAPEQFDDASSVDPRADLWSLGVMLYEMLTGERPFVAPSDSLLAATVRAGDVSMDAVPERWTDLLDQLLQVDPAQRLPSADALVNALDAMGPWSPPQVGSPIATIVRRHATQQPRPDDSIGGPPTEFDTYGPVSEATANANVVYAMAPTHNLPTKRDAFVGREQALTTLAQRFESGARLVSVIGIGGVGKTRFALHHARRTLTGYPGGTWFCDLSDAREISGVASAVARALEVPLGKSDAVVQLGRAIAARGRCLILLDNFEQVARHAEATLGQWLDRAEQAHFLVTTREVLGLSGEHTLNLPPLPRDEAVELFYARARQTDDGAGLSEVDRTTIGTLTDLLDGLPLAVELAAARTRVLSPTQLLERMGLRFQLLASGGRRHTRHATLRAALDWSWDLLAAPEQAALAQLSVFVGGFTLDAAEHVLDVGDLWVMDVVQSLLDKSLLDKSLVYPTRRRRFHLLVSVQEYAAEKLHKTDSRQAAEARHGRYFARFGTDASIEALNASIGGRRRRDLARDLENLVAACDRATLRRDGAVAAATLAAAWQVWGSSGPYPRVVGLARNVVEMEGLAEEHRMVASLTLGMALWRVGEPEKSRAALEVAAQLAAARSDRRAEGRALGSLGLLTYQTGRMQEGRARLTQALAIAREVGDRVSESRWLGELSNIESRSGRLDDARVRVLAAIAIARETGDQGAMSSWIGNLGTLDFHLGRMDEARGHFEEALAISRSLGDRNRESVHLGNLAVLNSSQGRLDESRPHFEAAVSIARELGNPYSEGFWLGNLGNLHRHQGRLEEARRDLQAALSAARQVGDRRGQALWLGGLGSVNLDRGDIGAAKQHFEQALAIAIELEDRTQEGVWLAELGRCAAAIGHLGEARRRFTAGLKRMRELDQKHDLYRFLAHRAAAFVEHDPDLAQADLDEVEQLAGVIGVVPGSEVSRVTARLREKLDR